MSDSEIAAWETKAKIGILHNDSNLENLISALKDAFFTAVGGTGKSATSIGISSGSYYGTDKGHIVLDTETLTSALKSDPETVISMFTGGSFSSSSSEQGIMYRMKSALKAYQTTATNSISNTETKIDDTDTEISDLEDKLTTLSDRYYAKFSAMETALAKLNSQASYISQLFSSSSS
jgi:flagellar hook-associated protein 2